jgi:NitT/TauT family transport system substrate-binding protein
MPDYRRLLFLARWSRLATTTRTAGGREVASRVESQTRGRATAAPPRPRVFASLCRFVAILIAIGILALQLACAPARSEAAAPTPAPSPAPPPTAASHPPPPRPTAAPAALSAASSPLPSPMTATSATPRQTPRVRAGQLGDLSDSGLLVGLAKGFYAEQAIDVQVVSFNAPGSMLSALNSGQLDVASVPMSVELYNALARGAGLKIVAEAAGAPPGHGSSGLIVRPDLVGRIRTPTDLRGFRIGLPGRGDSLEVQLAALLKQGWLARTDVEAIVLPAAAVGPAMADGGLEAAIVAEPHLTELQQRGLGRVWRRSDNIVPNHLTAALLFTVRFSNTQPEAARRYVTGYLKALRLYNDVFIRHATGDRRELVQILNRATTISDPAQFDHIVLPGMNPNGMVNVQTLLSDQKYFLDTGQQQKEVDLSAVVDTQYAAFAITQLGEYR